MRVSRKDYFSTTIPVRGGKKAELLHLLRERVKELTALHSAARMLQDDTRPVFVVLRQLAALLPPAWQYPEITAARISFEGREYLSRPFSLSKWSQKAVFRTSGGKAGEIAIFYLEEVPLEQEGPFLSEERYLLDSLAEMLCSYLERKAARSAIMRARDELEVRVQRRTAQLERLNRVLSEEIIRRKRKERAVREYQRRLKDMADELAVAEERERRSIAAELHERLGHNLALIKMRLAGGVRGSRHVELMRYLDDAIRMTRDITSELGSPVLYELGFEAAAESLAEQFREKHGVKLEFSCPSKLGLRDERLQLLLYKALRELLHNVVKHSGARMAAISLKRVSGRVLISVTDDGRGFEPHRNASGSGAGFGLFSIRERLVRFNGSLEMESVLGRGTRAVMSIPLPVTRKRGGRTCSAKKRGECCGD